MKKYTLYNTEEYGFDPEICFSTEFKYIKKETITKFPRTIEKLGEFNTKRELSTLIEDAINMPIDDLEEDVELLWNKVLDLAPMSIIDNDKDEIHLNKNFVLYENKYGRLNTTKSYKFEKMFNIEGFNLDNFEIVGEFNTKHELRNILKKYYDYEDEEDLIEDVEDIWIDAQNA